MARALLLVCLTALVPAAVGAKGSKGIEGDFVGPLRRVHDKASYEALLYVPSAVEAEVPTPLLVYLHGAGERGTDLLETISEGATGTPPVELRFGRAPEALSKRFAVVAPQTSSYWDPDRVDRLVSFLVEDRPGLGLRLDASRVYVTGHSMGGAGALDCAATGRFAAAVPVAAAGYADAESLLGVPVWAFHGRNDRVVPSRISERLVEELRGAGAVSGEARLTLFDEAPTPAGYPHAIGHASTIPAYATLELYDWLLQHRLPKSPQR